jgi:hypothetical protein
MQSNDAYKKDTAKMLGKVLNYLDDFDPEFIKGYDLETRKSRASLFPLRKNEVHIPIHCGGVVGDETPKRPRSTTRSSSEIASPSSQEEKRSSHEEKRTSQEEKRSSQEGNRNSGPSH